MKFYFEIHRPCQILARKKSECSLLKKLWILPWLKILHFVLLLILDFGLKICGLNGTKGLNTMVRCFERGVIVGRLIHGPKLVFLKCFVVEFETMDESRPETLEINLPMFYKNTVFLRFLSFSLSISEFIFLVTWNTYLIAFSGANGSG